MNFKGTPYKTEWVEYPDITPKFKGLGIKPYDENPPYAIPAAQMQDGTHVMESFAIAQALEKAQPEPSLRLDKTYVDRMQDAVMKVFIPLVPIVLPRVPELLLNETSAEYFLRTREARFGVSLPDLAKSERATKAWDELEAGSGLKDLKALLYEDESGPYVFGKEASYTDLVLAGLWVFLKKLDKGDVFDRILGYDEAFRGHYEACLKYLERDDH